VLALLQMGVPFRKLHFVVRIVLVVAAAISVLITAIAASECAGSDDWLGKWVAASASEVGNFVCTKPAPCGTWESFESKCWATQESLPHLQGQVCGGEKSCSFVTAKDADKVCKQNGATLAEIDNAAQDKYAYDLCSNADQWEDRRRGEGVDTIDINHCFFGLQADGDSSLPENWRWAGISTHRLENGSCTGGTYRNWLLTDQHPEPAGGGKTSASWVVASLIDDIMPGACFQFFGLLPYVVYLILVCISCSLGSLLVWCGITKQTQWCLAISAVLDGLMCGFVLILSIVNLYEGYSTGFFINIVLGTLFLTGSLVGCSQCCGLMEDSSLKGPTPVAAQIVGQPVELDND